jgi:hypothetical protein
MVLAVSCLKIPQKPYYMAALVIVLEFVGSMLQGRD